MRSKWALCLENTQEPTVPVVVTRVQAMTGYRQDGMSEFIPLWGFKVFLVYATPNPVWWLWCGGRSRPLGQGEASSVWCLYVVSGWLGEEIILKRSCTAVQDKLGGSVSLGWVCGQLGAGTPRYEWHYGDWRGWSSVAQRPPIFDPGVSNWFGKYSLTLDWKKRTSATRATPISLERVPKTTTVLWIFWTWQLCLTPYCQHPAQQTGIRMPTYRVQQANPMVSWIFSTSQDCRSCSWTHRDLLVTAICADVACKKASPSNYAKPWSYKQSAAKAY